MRGTTDELRVLFQVLCISTHVPHAGHDHLFQIDLYNETNFNSRAPCGARLEYSTIAVDNISISTHVPHAGHDYFAFALLLFLVHFNSRAPCGARLHMLGLFSAKIQYLVILRAKTPENICIFT